MSVNFMLAVLLLIDFGAVYYLCLRWPKFFLLYIFATPMFIWMFATAYDILFSDMHSDESDPVYFGIKLLLAMVLGVMLSLIAYITSRP